MLRPVWAFVHVLVSGLAVCWLFVTRRGRPLVFTHYQDMEGDRDHQMGPLVDSLQRQGGVIEVSFVPFPALFPALSRKRRLFVSHGAIHAVAWLLSLGTGTPARRQAARTRVARWLLLALRPEVLFLIDESGSGQPLLRAGRDLGIRVVGIQHGDFQPGNPQYDPGTGIEPADVLCVWSPWFRERLLRVSKIYDETNTVVTGRMRYPPGKNEENQEGQRAPPPLRILFLGEASTTYAQEVQPFLAALRSQPDIEVHLRPHPSDPSARDTSANGASLSAALSWCHVAVGSSSSALLEALWHHRPILVLITPRLPDPAGLVAAGLGKGCDTPERAPELCHEAHRDSDSLAQAARIVWKGTESGTFLSFCGFGSQR